MRTLTRQFCLFLVIALVMSPLQHVFAMQMVAQDDAAAQLSSVNTADMSSTHTGNMKMLGTNCSQHGKSGGCKSVNKCGTCPLSLETPRALLKRAVLSEIIPPVIKDVSLHSTNQMPDYRPPRSA